MEYHQQAHHRQHRTVRHRHNLDSQGIRHIQEVAVEGNHPTEDASDWEYKDAHAYPQDERVDVDTLEDHLVAEFGVLSRECGTL